MTKQTHFHVFTRATKTDKWQHEISFDNRRDAADEARDYREGWQQLKTKIVASTAQTYWEVLEMIASVNGKPASHPTVVDDDGNEIKPEGLCRRVLQHSRGIR